MWTIAIAVKFLFNLPIVLPMHVKPGLWTRCEAAEGNPTILLDMFQFEAVFFLFGFNSLPFVDAWFLSAQNDFKEVRSYYLIEGCLIT